MPSQGEKSTLHFFGNSFVPTRVHQPARQSLQTRTGQASFAAGRLWQALTTSCVLGVICCSAWDFDRLQRVPVRSNVFDHLFGLFENTWVPANACTKRKEKNRLQERGLASHAKPWLLLSFYRRGPTCITRITDKSKWRPWGFAGGFLIGFSSNFASASASASASCQWLNMFEWLCLPISVHVIAVHCQLSSYESVLLLNLLRRQPTRMFDSWVVKRCQAMSVVKDRWKIGESSLPTQPRCWSCGNSLGVLWIEAMNRYESIWIDFLPLYNILHIDHIDQILY